jgi:hypothetical protein
VVIILSHGTVNDSCDMLMLSHNICIKVVVGYEVIMLSRYIRRRW